MRPQRQLVNARDRSDSNLPTSPMITTIRQDILAGKSPILVELYEVLAALDVTERKLDNLVRQGQLDECTVVGPRRFFRSSQVRALLSGRRPVVAA